MPLTPEENQRIYEEEKARYLARQFIEQEAQQQTTPNPRLQTANDVAHDLKFLKVAGTCILSVIVLMGVGAVMNMYNIDTPAKDYYREAQQSFYGGKPPPPVVYRGDVPSARQISHQFVKKRLKSPSTAEFASEESGDETVQYSDGKYTVKGWVDAPNSFNAKLRNYFVCTVHYKSGTEWEADDIRIDESPINDIVLPTYTPPAKDNDWEQPHKAGPEFEEIVSDFSTSPLDYHDFINVDDAQIILLRNVPYAKHGYRFRDKKMREYFGTKSWYHPTTGKQSDAEKQMNAIERANLKIVLTQEVERRKNASDAGE